MLSAGCHHNTMHGRIDGSVKKKKKNVNGGVTRGRSDVADKPDWTAEVTVSTVLLHHSVLSQNWQSVKCISFLSRSDFPINGRSLWHLHKYNVIFWDPSWSSKYTIIQKFEFISSSSSLLTTGFWVTKHTPNCLSYQTKLIWVTMLYCSACFSSFPVPALDW